MAYLDWEARFDLGVSNMDNEHRGLIAVMNRLHELYEQGAGRAAMQTELLKLEKLTVDHFRHEEEYQASINFPELEVHRRVHENLLGRLESHKQAFLSGKDLTHEFFSFLRLWLCGHIAGIDQKYAKHAHKAA